MTPTTRPVTSSPTTSPARFAVLAVAGTRPRRRRRAGRGRPRRPHGARSRRRSARCGSPGTGAGVAEVELAGDGAEAARPPRGALRPPHAPGRRAAAARSPTPSRDGSPGSGASASRWTCAAGPSSRSRSGPRRSRSRPARSARTAGSRRRSGGRRRSGRWARRWATTRCRSSSRATASSARTAPSASTAWAGRGNKRTILAAEGLDPDALEDAARRGERLSGSTTTRIVCWPTCRHARRIAGPPPGRVPLAPGRRGGRLPAVQGLPPDGDRGRRVGAGGQPFRRLGLVRTTPQGSQPCRILAYRTSTRTLGRSRTHRRP